VLQIRNHKRKPKDSSGVHVAKFEAGIVWKQHLSLLQNLAHETSAFNLLTNVKSKILSLNARQPTTKKVKNRLLAQERTATNKKASKKVSRSQQPTKNVENRFLALSNQQKTLKTDFSLSATNKKR
jgi:hypothetical protein